MALLEFVPKAAAFQLEGATQEQMLALAGWLKLREVAASVIADEKPPSNGSAYFLLHGGKKYPLHGSTAVVLFMGSVHVMEPLQLQQAMWPNA